MLTEIELKQNQTFIVFNRKSFLNDKDAYQSYLNFVVEVSNSEIGYLHLFDETTNEIQLGVWSDNVFEWCTVAHDMHYPLDKAGFWADSVRQRQPVIHNDCGAAPSHNLPEGHYPIVRHVGIPVIRGGKVIAMIGLGNKAEPYTPGEVSYLKDAIDTSWSFLADKLRNILILEREMRKEYALFPKDQALLSILNAVSGALELRDEYTSHHQHKVAIISEKIATSMELPIRQIQAVRVGATLHDIGKIGIPNEILNRVRKLTPAEMELIKSHPVIGADLFRNISLPFPLADIIEQHHERLDGSGYPYGLKRDSILLEARIIGVADTFDAMSSDRPYRYAPGRDRAIDEIKSHSNSKYDPYVVEHLMQLIENDPDLAPGNMYR